MADSVQADEGRRLAAIMFTDMVGFTALAQRSEALAMELLEQQRGVIRPLLAAHNGREVDIIGDAFLVEFASALEAVRCAVAIQEALGGSRAAQPQAPELQVRIGIHLGDVIHRGTDVAGDAVNVASRIEPLAAAGGICVTAPVHASVVNKLEYRFESMGTPALKNVSTPIEVFRIAGYGVAVRASASATGLPKERVAVLPFANISPDPSDEYFADGMTEELISWVSRTKGLRVIARTSVMRYKGASKPIAEISRELNVGSVLVGSVRKAGDKVRVSVQLVDTSTEEPRWSEDYDRTIRDVFEIQSDIAAKVVKALHEQVLGVAATAEGRRATTSPAAYVSYLRGRRSWNTRTEQSLRTGIDLFQEAVGLDRDYAQAYSGLADSYATLALLEFGAPHEMYPKAKQAVGKALELDPGLAEAHSSLGLIRFQYDWDWPAAEAELTEAIRLNSNYAPAHQFYADYLKAMGRFDEARAEIEKAQDLDPLSLAISAAVGHVLYLSREYDLAIEQYRKAVALDPSFMVTHAWFGRPYLEKGMFAEALAELETAVTLSRESTLAQAMLGHGLAAAGRRDEALRILEHLKAKSKEQYVPSYWIAVVYNGLRDREQVMHWMQKAYEERSSWLVWSNVEPRFDWLRDDPGFAALMKAMKYP